MTPFLQSPLPTRSCSRMYNGNSPIGAFCWLATARMGIIRAQIPLMGAFGWYSFEGGPCFFYSVQILDCFTATNAWGQRTNLCYLSPFLRIVRYSSMLKWTKPLAFAHITGSNIAKLLWRYCISPVINLTLCMETPSLRPWAAVPKAPALNQLWVSCEYDF